MTLVLAATACSPEPTTEVSATDPSASETSAAETGAAETSASDTGAPEPVASAPTPIEPPAATPDPLTADPTAVVIEGPGWEITQERLDELVEFVATTHALDFKIPAGLRTVDDIGASMFADYEAFLEHDWAVLQLLGIVDPTLDRADVNQVRRDRIVGICCSTGNPALTVVTVETDAERLATEYIIVHELTHALHTQHQLLNRDGFNLYEYPDPFAATVEAVPELIAGAWLAQLPADQQARVRAAIEIIPGDLLDRTGEGGKRLMEFGYELAPQFLADLYAEGGADVLHDLITNAPKTTEQIMFPEKWLAGETSVKLDALPIPTDARPWFRGVLGASMLQAALVEQLGEHESLELVRPWAGGGWHLYRSATGDSQCLTAQVLMDTAPAAAALSDALAVSIPTATLAVDAAGTRLLLDVCMDASSNA